MLVALLALLPARGAAQVSVIAGGAAAVPLAGFADVAELGYQGLLGASVELGSGAAVAVEGFYGRNSHRIAGERSEIYGLSVLAGYPFLDAGSDVAVTPWVGVGGTVHARRSDRYPGLDASRSGLTLNGGATVSKGVGRVRMLASAFYIRGLGTLRDGFPTELVTLGAGVEIPIGSDGRGRSGPSPQR